MKVSKARKAKIELLYELLDEAEKAECRDVYGLRAQVKMVCLVCLRNFVRLSQGWSRGSTLLLRHVQADCDLSTHKDALITVPAKRHQARSLGSLCRLHGGSYCDPSGLTYQTYLRYTPDPEAQFMVGLFHATGLGGIEEDQGLVSPIACSRLMID